MNKVTLVGNLTQDPILRSVNVGGVNINVCNFNIAANQGYGERQKTTYFRINAWRGLADICAQNLTKGRQIFVEGSVSGNAYIGTDGKPYFNLEVQADNIIFLGSRAAAPAAPAPAAPNYDAPPAEAPNAQVVTTETDELPF